MSYAVPRLELVIAAMLVSVATPFGGASAQALPSDGAEPTAVEVPLSLDLPPSFLDGPKAPEPPEMADGVPVGASDAAGKVIKWVLATHDNGDLPFIVIDKVGAEFFVYDPSGRALAAAPALVGIAKGDDSTPGVGDRELSDIPVADRTTPAGRFVAKFGPAADHSEDVLWVDFTDAISLHPVITTKPKERRTQRLASATPDDNRITFGCINVKKDIYDTLVAPLFKPAGGVVYILPEVRPLSRVFAGLAPEDPLELASFDDVFAGYELRGPVDPSPSAGR